MFGLSTLKLIGYGLGALAIIALLAMVNGWRVERDHLRAWQSDVIAATVDAGNLKDKAGKPAKLAAKDVPEQIRLLGKAIADVRQKTAEIEASDAKNARVVEAHQTNVSQESSHDYEVAIADARARADRLRRDRASGADQGRGGKPPVPGSPPGASGPDAATAEDGLSDTDALIATEQAIQLKAIQKLICDEGLAVAVCPASKGP